MMTPHISIRSIRIWIHEVGLVLCIIVDDFLLLDSHVPIPTESVHDAFEGFSFVEPSYLDTSASASKSTTKRNVHGKKGKPSGIFLYLHDMESLIFVFRRLRRWIVRSWWTRRVGWVDYVWYGNWLRKIWRLPFIYLWLYYVPYISVFSLKRIWWLYGMRTF